MEKRVLEKKILIKRKRVRAAMIRSLRFFCFRRRQGRETLNNTKEAMSLGLWENSKGSTCRSIPGVRA